MVSAPSQGSTIVFFSHAHMLSSEAFLRPQDARHPLPATCGRFPSPKMGEGLNSITYKSLSPRGRERSCLKMPQGRDGYNAREVIMRNEIHCFFHGVLANTLKRRRDYRLNLLLIKDFADLRGRRQATVTIVNIQSPIVNCQWFVWRYIGIRLRTFIH